jgi:hypothetical protein
VNVIEQTNYLVRIAIAAVRIDRNPLTMSRLYDSLNFRRNARVAMPDHLRKAWSMEIHSDLRNYGSVERTHAELAAAVTKHCQKT